ncbi:SRPBCC family protein [Rhodococcus sp. T2V]|uniref:SRPBCC family protein n=1 Tax=Rhodococcus sp. T2V TaxID=3034164 RepID=UPI0023E14F61|nr:SRPBCC family protein [Rhodococcus sp. T2V]MDF3309651.1 SRPBCC family protein [Rhodococcus sp. T2V]
MRFSTTISVDVDAAWAVLDRYTRAESRLFHESRPVGMERIEKPTDGRQSGNYRVVTYDGVDVWELDVSTEPDHRRLAYTIPGFGGAVHHQAVLELTPVDDKSVVVPWVTDVYPDSYLDLYPHDVYQENFDHLAASLERGDANTVAPATVGGQTWESRTSR